MEEDIDHIEDEVMSLKRQKLELEEEVPEPPSQP